jgi:hypothetical protein
MFDIRNCMIYQVTFDITCPERIIIRISQLSFIGSGLEIKFRVIKMEIVPIYLFTNRSNVASANGYYSYQDILFTSKPNLGVGHYFYG